MPLALLVLTIGAFAIGATEFVIALVVLALTVLSGWRDRRNAFTSPSLPGAAAASASRPPQLHTGASP